MLAKIKIGVIAPTYNRPDFARFLSLQMANQTVHPDLLAFHQNGTTERYEWAVADVQRTYAYAWLHSPMKLPQEYWYAIPLDYLIAHECTHFFWTDHDDIYGCRHIETGVMNLDRGYDHVLNTRSSLLLLKRENYRFESNTRFSAHDPGGMSSSMCFNRAFACALLQDLRANACKRTSRLDYADQVVRRVTMPKFCCLLNHGPATTTYVCHADTVSSSHWLLD
jgi:hypothetical protein